MDGRATAPAGFRRSDKFAELRERPKGQQVVNVCHSLRTGYWLSDHIAARNWRRPRRLGAEAGRAEAASLELVREIGFPFLDQYNDAQVSAMIASVVIKNYLPGHIVVEQDDPGNELLLIFEGEVEITRANVQEPLARLGPGQSFGEMALVAETPRRATVTALTGATVGFLHRDVYQRSCRNQKLMDESRILSVISRAPPFNVCYQPTLVRVAQTSSHIHTDTGMEVCPRAELEGACIIVLHGEIEVRASMNIWDRQYLIDDKSKYKARLTDIEMENMRLSSFEGIPLMHLAKGDYWGHDLALGWDRDWVNGVEFSDFHVVATTPGRVLLIRPDSFWGLLHQDRSLKELLAKRLKMEYNDVRDRMLQITLLLNKYDFVNRSGAYLKQIHDLIREKHVAAQMWTWNKEMKRIIKTRESEELKRKAEHKFEARNQRVRQQGMQNIFAQLRQKPQMSSSLPNLRH